MSPATAPHPSPALSHAFLPRPRVATALFLSASLVACGGTGGGGISANADGEVLLTAGQATIVGGTLESVKYRLTDMRWSVMPRARQMSNSATLSLPVLVNQDCQIAEKNDAIAITPDTSTVPGGSGGSTWRCNLALFAQHNSTTDMLYDLVLTGRNESGQHISFKRTLRIQPNPALNAGQTGIDAVSGAVVNDDQAFSDLAISPIASVCKPGAPLRLQAMGIDSEDLTLPLSYRWRIVQGPQAVLAGQGTATTGFIVPDEGTVSLMVIELAVSRSPLQADSPARYTARALVSSDPAYPFPQCSSIQS